MRPSTPTLSAAVSADRQDRQAPPPCLPPCLPTGRTGRHPHTRWWDLPAALLLWFALSTAAGRLVATEWIEHLTIAQALVFLGVLAGLALGQSIFSSRLAATLALAYGLFAVPLRLGVTLGLDILWTDRLVSLAGRLNSALGQLARQEAVRDPLFFLSLMAILFWSLGVHAGYTLTRRGDVWRTILPTGLALLIIHISDPYVTSRAWFLAVYVFLSLLLVARLVYLRNRAHWRQTQAHVSSFIVLDLTRVILTVTTLLVLLAWTIPTLADALPAAREAWQEATDPLRTAMRERLDNVFASLRRAVGVTTITDRYGRSLSLGSGSELTDALVLTVQAPPRPAAVMRYYWRARAYDHYADGEWSSVTFSTTLSVSPAGPSPTFPDDVEPLEGRRTVTFTFTSAVPIATLYAASQPRWVSRHAHVDMARNPNGAVDPAAWRAVPPLLAGETYQARSTLSSVTVAQLRAAGDDYPLWVTSRYLQLPSTVTTRTRELARQIAAGMDNPYDVAAAVTGYLRAAIHYTETISSPPSDQELLDWFLFDLRQGFCNYYASSEVILLRSLGIPARLVVGYAEGERQPRSNTYLVRHRDAHAWPEVYFPGVGWIEFEPTVSQAPLDRPPGESESGAEAGSTPGGIGGGDRDRFEERLEELLAQGTDPLSESSVSPSLSPSRTPLLWALLLALGLILIALALVWRNRRQRGLPPLPVILEAGLRRFDLQPPAALRRWTLYATLSPLARAYLELDYALARLGAPPAPADTPAERTAALAHLLPVAADPAQRLLAEYQATTYSPQPGDLRAAQQASRVIRTLSWQTGIKKRADSALRPLRVFVRLLTGPSP